MPEGSGLAWAAGALLASEALGITNFSGGQVPQVGAPNVINVPSGGGGGPALDLSGFRFPEAPAINYPDIDYPDITIPGGNGGNGGGGGGGGASDMTRAELMKIWRHLGGDRTPWDPTGGGDRSPTPKAEGGNLSAGVDPLRFLMESWRGAGEAASATIKTAGEGFDFGKGFTKENPYFTAGTTIGAISPDPITTGAGAAVGGLTEITADTLTGNTPLGVQSPIDVTSGGAWWKGPDPLNLKGPWFGNGGGD